MASDETSDKVQHCWNLNNPDIWWWWLWRYQQGDTTSVNCSHQRAYCSSARWYVSMDRHGGILLTGVNSSFHQICLAILQAESSSSKARGIGEGYDAFFRMKYIVRTSKSSLTCRTILRHGADGFTSAPNEGVLRTFMSLKPNRSQPGFNPRTLRQMDPDIVFKARNWENVSAL
jgi:hypothetical protein